MIKRDLDSVTLVAVTEREVGLLLAGLGSVLYTHPHKGSITDSDAYRQTLQQLKEKLQRSIEE